MNKGPESLELKKLVAFLERSASKNKAKVWKTVAKLLSKASRKKNGVSVVKLSRVTKANEVVIIPCKMLSGGELKHALTVAVWKASKKAVEQVTKAGGSVITIKTLVEKNPKGSKTRIIT
jgi:large subunit ribosomal protein L18e